MQKKNEKKQSAFSKKEASLSSPNEEETLLPSDLLAKLNREILEVIKKHISIDQEKIQESLFFPRVGIGRFVGAFSDSSPIFEHHL
ncbi:cell division topological specificity factor MinE [Entomobacter blattae]|uniref:cell division topological specificity factor MinE n=1 Tax=Entomobacter blattae TaxID=2762277 RepID=UPI00193C13CA|nr:cell division topological specificity factor MinE [Entomobacter blattae]